jgi:hypothetical protein
VRRISLHVECGDCCIVAFLIGFWHYWHWHVYCIYYKAEKTNINLNREDKMKLTTQQITDALVAKFANTKFTGCTRRNGRPSEGYAVPGKSKWTNAVKNAGLTWYHFWSGSAPTPSTQYPQEIADYIASIDN